MLKKLFNTISDYFIYILLMEFVGGAILFVMAHTIMAGIPAAGALLFWIAFIMWQIVVIPLAINIGKSWRKSMQRLRENINFVLRSPKK